MGDRLAGIVEYIVCRAARTWFRLAHRVTVEGLENIPPRVGKLVIVANHGSLLDGPLLWAFLPLRFKSLIAAEIAAKPVLRLFLTQRYVIPVSTLNSYSVKSAVQAVDGGMPLLLFPEGQRSRTGALMKIYEGAGFIAARTGATILPVHITNNYAIYTSRSPVRRRWFARLKIRIGPASPPLVDLVRLPPRRRRQEASRLIYRLLSEQKYLADNRPSTIGREFVRLCRENRGRVAFKDVSREETSYGRALAGAFLLGGFFSCRPETHIGVALPTVTPAVLLFFGLQLYRKVPVLLNYALGPAALRYMMDLADLRTVVTSREFLDRLGIKEEVFAGSELVFLEDLRGRASLGARVRALFRSRFPGSRAGGDPAESGADAVILFTSGSEGPPKGVCLTHESIISNIHQCLARIDIRENDYLLNAMPLFHSFGLTVGALMPLFAGCKAFLYVNPLHYRNVPETAYSEGCTILIGTNTFLNGYRKKANPYDFYALRYVYCGAEALLDPVFDAYAKKFGIRVMSGYGSTECAPVISMNNPLEYEYGTVGAFLPGIEHRLVRPAGAEYGPGRRGVLYVKGKNNMRGYLKNEAANRKYLVDDGGWYDTGDIVEITESGFVRILGRRKRFAKVSGEMVSLGGLEEALEGAFGERVQAAVIAVPDEKRGERILLVADSPRVALAAAREILRGKGFPEIALPKELYLVPRIPRLGTGKIDYPQLARLVYRRKTSRVPSY